MLRLTTRVDEKDSGWDKLAKNLEKLARKSAKVGIQANEDSELIQYATQNEFGADIGNVIIPSRPFIRQTFEKRFDELKKIGFEFGGVVIDGKMTLDSALELWGDKFVSFIRSEIAEGDNFIPNAPLTIKLKGEGLHPLQGKTGRLQQALKSVVEDS
jgi:hypothetical protein